MRGPVACLSAGLAHPKFGDELAHGEQSRGGYQDNCAHRCQLPRWPTHAHCRFGDVRRAPGRGETARWPVPGGRWRRRPLLEQVHSAIPSSSFIDPTLPCQHPQASRATRLGAYAAVGPPRWRTGGSTTSRPATLEVRGGYLWSSKSNRNGARNQTYDNMLLAKVGDTVYSCAHGRLGAIGVVIRAASPCPKPVELSTVGDSAAVPDESS